ncbi:hypothetical protein ACQ4M4_06885 [Leptolyngbya sp. AN02str]|uniref:hypothetical protein n=1 Tax=Leptolyngbya sp. AN02str TaxID=3423363 RepID=UPI003D3103CF
MPRCFGYCSISWALIKLASVTGRSLVLSMQLRLADLHISTEVLENVTGLDISPVFMGRAVRPSTFRDPKRLLSFVVSQLITLGVIVVFCLPASLVIARNLPGFTGDAASTARFLQISLGISVGLFVVWNGYLWMQTRSRPTLAHLLDTVDKHNDMIAALRVLDELAAAQSAASGDASQTQVRDRANVLTALSATRESLISALMTERILRKHQRVMARRHELFTTIETNLATLQALNLSTAANDYGQLLNEALEIGMSVRQEIERLK